MCYYYGKRDTVYEELGHAEVVQMDLTKNPEKEMEVFAKTYFKQFQKTRCLLVYHVQAIIKAVNKE